MVDDKAIPSVQASILKKLLGVGLLIALLTGLALLLFPSPHLFQRASAQSSLPFRAVPVRLKSGHLEYRTSIRGLESGGEGVGDAQAGRRLRRQGRGGRRPATGLPLRQRALTCQ